MEEHKAKYGPQAADASVLFEEAQQQAATAASECQAATGNLKSVESDTKEVTRKHNQFVTALPHARASNYAKGAKALWEAKLRDANKELEVAKARLASAKQLEKDSFARQKKLKKTWEKALKKVANVTLPTNSLYVINKYLNSAEQTRVEQARDTQEPRISIGSIAPITSFFSPPQ